MVTKTFEDFAFIRFKRTLAEALEVGNAPTAEIFNEGFVTLSSDEAYCQVTNANFNINFGQDYKAELVDICGRVLIDVSERFYMEQFLNDQIEEFTQQIYWEVINLPPFYGRSVVLKVTHWDGTQPASPLVLYSNPFHIEPNPLDTTRLDYKRPADLLTQSIRIKAAYQQPTPNSEIATYLQSQTGNTIAKSAPMSLSYEYLVEYFNNLGLISFEYFRTMVAAKYITNGNNKVGHRLTTLVPTRETRAGNSNFYKGGITAYIDKTEVFTPEFQIAPPLILEDRSPLGQYTLTSLPTEIKGTFNVSPILGIGTLTVYNSEGGIVATYDQNDIVITGNTFVINTGEIITENGEYSINFTDELFSDSLGQFATDSGDWLFSIAEGEFDGTEFDGSEFFTNI